MSTALALPLPSTPALLALARVEARRLLRHPALLVGVVVNAAAIALLAGQPGQVQSYLISGFIALGLGAGTFLAANLAAMRDRRGGAEELLAPLPHGAATRTGALLIALLATVPLSVAAVVAAYVAFGAGDGLVIHELGTTRVPPLIELVQAPFGVLLLGAAGVALGRWAPTPLLAPLVLAVLFTLEIVLVSWGSQSPVQWLLPFSADVEFAPDAWVPCTAQDTEPGCGLITGFDVTGMGWHLAYLVAMTAVCCAAALLRGATALVYTGIAGAGVAALMLAVG